MKKPQRYITTLLLIMTYLLMVFSPFVSIAMQSKLIAHTVMGQCSGDCSIDGCSLERSTARTCCCWLKKQRESGEYQQPSKKGCCSTQQAPPVEVASKGLSCCSKQARIAHEDSAEQSSVSSPAPQKKRTTTVSSRPCGSDRLFTLGGTEIAQHLPCFFVVEITLLEQITAAIIPPDRLLSRFGDPPDPPPIIS